MKIRKCKCCGKECEIKTLYPIDYKKEELPF